MNYKSITTGLRDRLLESMKRPAYHYTLDRCVIRDWPSLEALDTDIGKTLAMIVPDKQTAGEMASHTVEMVASVDIVAARALRQGSDSFWDETKIDDTRTESQDKLVEDIERAVYGWNYTSLAENIEITERNRSAIDTYVEGWAVVFFTLRLQWEQVWRTS